MKKVIFVAVMVLMGLSGYAQTENTGLIATPHSDHRSEKFGYLSIDSVLQSMPEYACNRIWPRCASNMRQR